ncbi:unnamed protein product [Paramecium octaurelia]|uniref:Uncharacterized protein n=1 Tax=Paramecium octaurelia TaxID=43137 RepID=A0A8S1WLK3_PAROT|nr:unnamed protein product [Paramecium octaurelia]
MKLCQLLDNNLNKLQEVQLVIEFQQILQVTSQYQHYPLISQVSVLQMQDLDTLFRILISNQSHRVHKLGLIEQFKQF